MVSRAAALAAYWIWLIVRKVEKLRRYMRRARAHTVRCMAVCLRLSECRFMWWEETHSHIFFTFEWDSLNLCVDKRKPDLCDQIGLKMSSQHFPLSSPLTSVMTLPPAERIAHIGSIDKTLFIVEGFPDCVEAKGFVTERQIRFWLLIFPFYYRRREQVSSIFGRSQTHSHLRMRWRSATTNWFDNSAWTLNAHDFLPFEFTTREIDQWPSHQKGNIRHWVAPLWWLRTK